MPPSGTVIDTRNPFSLVFVKHLSMLCFTNIDLKNRTSHYPASAVYLFHYFNCFRSELPSLGSLFNSYRHTNHGVVACADESHHYIFSSIIMAVSSSPSSNNVRMETYKLSSRAASCARACSYFFPLINSIADL